MYCSSYLIGYLLLQLTRTAFSTMNNEDDVFRIVTRAGETKEPSCEELHRMWRHSKREIQQKLDMTPSPRYKGRYQEPISYGWKSPARPRTAMYSKPVYGRLVLSPDNFLYRNVPNRQRSYEQVARMVGAGSPTYYNGGSNVQKPSHFRLDYPNPVRRPLVPVRISHIGRFQELQNLLRNDRAKEEMQMTKIKQSGEREETASPDFPNDQSESSKYNRYSQSNEDDATAGNDRKFRGSGGQNTAADSTYSDENNTGSETRNESESSQSTSKPVMTDDTIVHRWALGEWRR